MLENLDEVIYVDWNTPDELPSLAEEVLPDLVHKEKFFWIRIPTSQVKEYCADPEAQTVTEVLARNIGMRRLTTDYLVSTDIDIICPPRKDLDRICGSDMVILAERSICPFDLWEFGNHNEYDKYSKRLREAEKDHPQKPDIQLFEGDMAALISSCGDFQLAPKEIWYAMRGFEESLIGRAFADGNVQRKAQMLGYNVVVDRSLPMWHIGHEGGQGGTGKINDMLVSMLMERTGNSETWGFYEKELIKHHGE